MARFRLRIELIPEPLWGQNLRSNVVGLGPGRWLKLSQQVRKRVGKCSVCGGTERLHGHEVWQYAERARSGTAKLIDVSVICTICHSINHWGRISALIAAGIMTPADGRRLIRHFVKINRCVSKASFERHRLKAFAEWRERNRKKWKIDWGPYAPAITEAKGARALNRTRRQAAVALRDAALNLTTVAGAT